MYPIGGTNFVRTLSLCFDEFGQAALDAEAERHGIARPTLVANALLYYLSDLDSGRVAVRVPSFSQDGRPRSLDIELELELDPGTWDELGNEAERQQVSRERLIEHATMYYLADADSGRLARRIYERSSKRFKRDAG